MNRFDKRTLERFFGRRTQRQARLSDHPIPVRWGVVPANVREVDPAAPPPSFYSRILDDPGRIADLWELVGRERATWNDPRRLTGPTMMALPELVANSPVPGALTALTTLGANVTTTGATTITTNAAAPTWLQAAGQFRIVIDNEIMLVTAGATGTTWTVTRGGSLAAPDTCTSATHSSGASIYHYLTAGALINVALQSAFPAATVTVASTTAPANQQAASTFICDGTTDQVEINSGIVALPAGGGLLLLSEGAFNTAAPIVFQRDTAALLGMARGTTIIAMASGFSGATMLTCNRDDLGSGVKPCQEIEIGNFTVNGNKLGTQSTTDGILFKASRSTLRDVEVYWVNGAGVRVRGVTAAERLAAGGPNLIWTTYGTTVRTCKLHENGNGGLWEDAACTDGGVNKCEIFQNCGPGILDSGGSLNEIEGCYVWQNFDQSVAGGSAIGNAIQIQSGSGRTNIVNNKIEQNRGGLRIIAGSEFQIVGNVLASNSTSADGTQASSGALPAGWLIAGAHNVRSDLEILGSGGAPSDIVFVANTIDPLVYSGDESAYAIVIQSGTNILARFNNLKAGQTGTINNTLGGTNIFSCGQNLGYITEASGQATITSAVTSVAVTHGLAYAPLAQDIAVMLTNLPTNAIGELYVDTIGSTTFTIRCRNAPGVLTAVLGWSVQTHRFTT